MGNANIALSKEALEDLTRLSKVKKQPVQELIEGLVQEAVEHEEDMALLELSIQRNVPGAETVDFEDIKWD
ncbi:uncharacterized protein TNCT_725271 [Trichonephila clavata]|uniref:Uncharacterized protein n=1 Tax=Trichonephila clavata TaxID=2740835 RepID=A0A8X6FL21_TRICU|nr:uncharacterized protein TNCT_725271 [Trichonephila clavata]